MTGCLHMEHWPCADCLHPDQAKAARTERFALAKRKRDAPTNSDPAFIAGAVVERVSSRVEAMLPRHLGGLGLICPVCEHYRDEKGYCPCDRAKTLERDVGSVLKWLGGISDPKARKGQQWVAMAAVRRATVKAGRDEPIEHGQETLPLIAAASLELRKAFSIAAANRPSRGAVADDLPI